MSLDARTLVRDILSRSLSINTYDEFTINLNDDIVTNQFNSCYEELCQFLKAPLPNNQNIEQLEYEKIENAVRKEATQELVSQIFLQQHTKKQLLLLRIVTKLVRNRVTDVRHVCEFMLGNLVYFDSTSNSNANSMSKTTPSYIWCKILECIIRFIPLQDYKACRDIFKMLLEVIKRIPYQGHTGLPIHYEDMIEANKFSIKRLKSNDDTATVTDDIKLESLYKTLSIILDSDNYFMPKYLAIHEIKLVLKFGKEPYHERFHNIITEFVDSFVPTANLISISGRNKFLPIVGFSNLCSLYSFWRFNPSTCKYNSSGPLPYIKQSFKPHQEVFFYLLRQNSPQYLLLALMSLHRNVKQRFPAVEEEFCNTILDTMRLTEETSSNTFENLRIWNNLVCQYLGLNQIINLMSIMNQLSNKLCKKSDSFKQSRDWLMWFLLSTITTHLNRNCLPDFSELFEILYKDDEPIAAPEYNQLLAVIKLAPLAIWTHLNFKASTSTGSIKPMLIVPNQLKHHSYMLQDFIKNQNFKDYALSVCLNAYSTDTSSFTSPFNALLDRIGKSSFAAQQQMQLQQQQISINTNSPGQMTHKPLSTETILSLSLHVKTHICNYLNYMLLQKVNMAKSFVFNIPAAIPETFARLIILDPENFIKFFLQNFWQVLCPPNLIPPLQTPTSVSLQVQTLFIQQQVNLAIELIAYRFKHLSFTQRIQFLILLNNLFISSQAPMQQQQQQQQQNASNAQQQIQQPRPEQLIYIKHPQIYMNAQYAMLKILSSFSGTDYYELVNSLPLTNKQGPKNFINSESEEINKAIVFTIARAVHMASSDLQPHFENKDKDDTLRSVLKLIIDTTPIYFHDYVLEHFPKVMQQYLATEQAKRLNERTFTDSSNRQYKIQLKRRVDEDFNRFAECRHETQAQTIFQNQSYLHTLICVFFNLLQDDSIKQNFNTYLQFILSNLNGMENKKMSLSLRTFCDYLIIESTNKPNEILEKYVNQILKMINVYNIFSYDRLLFIMTFRSFDSVDFQLSMKLLTMIFVQNREFKARFNDFQELWNANSSDNEEWSVGFYSSYMSKYPEKFFYEGIKEQLGMPINDSVIRTYYDNVFFRCIYVLDYLNSRYIELKQQSADIDSLLDNMNILYKYHSHPISFVYNTLVYYNTKLESNSLGNADQMDVNQQVFEYFDQSKKRRLLNILTINNAKISPYFSTMFQSYIQMSGQNSDKDIRQDLNEDYYFTLLKRMLPNDHEIQFDIQKSEFLNPPCHLIYITLCELIFLDLFSKEPIAVSRSICQSIIQLFLAKKSQMNEKKDFTYWISSAGLVISNLPEPYWLSIYEYLSEILKKNEVLNSKLNEDETSSDQELIDLLDRFDLILANEKNCFDELTLVVTLYHSIWCHASASHFLYFIRYIKDSLLNEINTEKKFLFICKLIGPFLSKIHMENTNLLIELVNILYDMILLVSNSNETMHFMDTTCNFFYHLKYRHIGEAVKEKIYSIMPHFRPEIQKLFKYVVSDFSEVANQQQIPNVQTPLSNR